MPSRRSHQNSHHGCAQCKERRVKCDEARPVCLRCSRQGRDCTYASLGPGTSWATTSPVASISPPIRPPPMQLGHAQSSSLQLSPSILKVEPPDSLGPPTPSSSSSTGIRIASLLSPASPSVSANGHSTPRTTASALAGAHHLQDLKLMHHWASQTPAVVPCRPRTEAVWRDFVAQQALEHDFLLHSLFAVSAFHLAATEEPDRQLHKDVALEHHSLSISLAQPALKDINERNCHALFAFSCFTAIVSFATPHLTDLKTRAPLKEVIDGFLLWRGISAVVESCFEAVAQGPMGTLFYIPDHKHPELMNAEMRASMGLLEQRNDALSVGATERQGYAGAISQLYILFASCSYKQEDIHTETAVFGWPILVPKDYIDTLWKAEPMALAILAHYAVMLHGLNHVWWASRWGPELVDAVDALLDASWDECLKWPKEKVHAPPEDFCREVEM